MIRAVTRRQSKLSKTLIAILLSVVLPALMCSVARASDAFDFNIDSEQIKIDGRVLVEVTPLEPGRYTNIGLTIKHNDREIFSSDTLGPDVVRFSFTPKETGEYVFDVVGKRTDGAPVEQTRSINVRAVKISNEETARGVLILMVSGGVLLSLTIGFVIILRTKIKPRRVS
jgi:hypothetical protein